MLKALELVGFKSFADKTRFEFPAGITVVVGPNGSGKSNVVDAIKWVLGEQSVKSLRGKDMVDVIFNGSATRRPLNSAETTLIFDNSDGRLPTDAPEVHITRRVYRSGEGEYLLNRQPCRLRDIRDLFAGTGAATEAYSVIEQGKVDVLLQSSPRERRVIFEEAAGISRFKLKKIEALRRLERVEQNLLRLKDIVDEVEGRLLTVRQQAGKARRYKELADRLQALRVQVGWTDWRQFTDRLESVESEIGELRIESASAAAEAETIETRALSLETEMAEIDRMIRTSEARISENRERLAGLESTIEHERSHVAELEEQAARHRRQLASMSVRANDVDGQMEATRAAAAGAQTRHRQQALHLADHERAFTALTSQLDQIRAENEQRRTTFLEETRAAATLANEIGGLESKLAHAEAARDSCRSQQAELTTEQNRLAGELAELQDRHRRLEDQMNGRAAALADAQNQLAEIRRRQTAQQKELSRWQERHAAGTERARVLAELESRLEGVSNGVKEVLMLAGSEPEGPFGAVRGMLADLLQVEVQTAAFIELALGEKAQYLVLGDNRRLHEFLSAEERRFAGRVGFLTMAGRPTLSSAANLTGQPGVLDRADRFVQIAAEYAPLDRQMLGRTWIVENLTAALALAQSPAGSGQQFVTLGGQLLDADGTLTVGPLQGAAGLISRRSELRALTQQIGEFERNIQQLQSLQAQLEQQLLAQDRDVTERTVLHGRAAEELAEGRMRLGTVAGRQAQLESQQAALVAAEQEADRQSAALAAALATSRATLEQQQTALAHADERIHDNARRIAQLDESREIRTHETMSAKVELARSEQQLDHLQTELRRFEQDRDERQRALADSRDQLTECVGKIREAEQRILAAEGQLAELYLRKEGFGGESIALVNRRETHRAERATALDDAQRRRARIRRIEDKLHKRELTAGEIRHERTTLVDRLREDYGIDLTALEPPPASESPVSGSDLSPLSPGGRGAGGEGEKPPAIDNRPRAQIEEEIADLRGKLASLGNVNLDALHEADELEQRFGGLSGQYEDLTKAKSSLEQIVVRINTDSRRLFAETLETVRGHFQTLFRKLFGGGQAEIVMEEGVDILDGGIEIVARPPGKEPRNISLLSGGEKTLTCFALLLAVFSSRPSPFCVLDEVDSALDEANIERFIGVLEQFLSWTQFIIVTHSKKTMTAANTLYGVTMQESGVSKRVSVRFEDVSENGDILPTAAAREAANSDGEESARAA